MGMPTAEPVADQVHHKLTTSANQVSPVHAYFHLVPITDGSMCQ